MSSSDTITIALDWTPNTNHTGFFVALAQGMYREAGLEVKIVAANDPIFKGSYHDDQDATSSYCTPCGLVASKRATFALNSPEGVVHWQTHPDAKQPKLIAVAACLQRSTSAIVTLTSSGLTRPRDLDGKVYASYAARFEGRIVQRMIQNDGGKGEFEEKTPPMLGLFSTVCSGEADATWVFMGWEGVEATRKDIQLNAFKLEDYGIPYGYAPCLVTHPDNLKESGDAIKKFLSATSRGFQFAAANPKDAAQILIDAAKEHCGYTFEDNELVFDSQSLMSSTYLDSSGCWGRMADERWEDYIQWLKENNVLTKYRQSRNPIDGESVSLDDLRNGNMGDVIEDLDYKAVFTNEFLE